MSPSSVFVGNLAVVHLHIQSLIGQESEVHQGHVSCRGMENGTPGILKLELHNL